MTREEVANIIRSDKEAPSPLKARAISQLQKGENPIEILREFKEEVLEAMENCHENS